MKIFEKIKEKQYWKKRAKLWKNFKENNDINTIHNEISEIKCGLVKKTPYYTPFSWEYECNNCSYDKEFFDKYGCMYIKGFMNY